MRVKRQVVSWIMVIAMVFSLFPVSVKAGMQLRITEQPSNVSAKNGTKVEFKVSASGDGLNYAWYFRNPNTTGTEFRQSSNTTDTYRITADATSHSQGFYVYCVVSDSTGESVQSDTAILTIDNAVELAITGQPESVTVQNGAKAEFKVSARGDGLSYTWYYRNPNTTGTEFRQSSNKTDTYQITADATSHSQGFYVYCVVSDSRGNKVQSETATLTIGAPAALAIIGQPESVTAQNGTKVEFKVKATGDGLNYKWYYRNPNTTGVEFRQSSNATDTYRITADATSHSQGFYVYCVVSDSHGNKVQSETATLTIGVSDALAITGQPESVTAQNGTKVKFKVSATGDNLRYKWFYRNPNTTGTEYRQSSNATDTYTITADATSHSKGFYVYCVVSDSHGNKVQSETASLTIGNVTMPVITGQPKSVDAQNGTKVEFKVSATGDDLSYKWYYRNPNTTGEEFRQSSNTSNTYSITANQTSHSKGFYVYCVVTDSHGNSVTSEVAKLSIKTQAFKVTYDAGEGAFPAGGIFAKAESEWGYTFNQNRTAASENLEVGGHYIPDWIAPEREGYNFLGWTLNGKVVRNVNVTDSDITLTAVWEAGIKVTYDANGGYWLFDEEEGSFTTFDMIQPAGAYYLGWHEPQRDGYQFAGWTVNDQYVSRINLTQPVTVKATWNKIYTVTYDANGGKFYNVWDDAQQKEITGTTMTRIQNDGNMNYWVGVSGDEEPVYAAQNEEMVFCGWSTNKNATPGEANMGFEVVATGNFTVYAIWTKGYTVTLNANGGVLYYENDVAVTSKAYTDYNPGEGFELFLRPEHREGCEFLGWSTNQKATEPTYGDWDRVYPSVNTTLYAIWQKYPTITYDANGGYWNEWDNEKQEDVQVFYRYEWRKNGQRCHVRNQAPDREGYRFDGWMDANGNVIEEENPLVMDKDYIVKAKWVKQIQVTYNANGGSWGNETLRYWDGEEGLVHIGEEWPQWNGNGEMCFAGWSTSPNATQADADFDVELHDDAVYYAIWCRPFTVTFDANGGWLWEDRDGFVTTDTRESVWYGDFDVDQWANRDGYEFLGWSTNKSAKAAEYPINGSGEERRAFLKQATTFYAVWEKLPWITYDANGGFWGGYEPENQIDERETTRVDWDKAGYYYYVGQEQPWRDGYEFNGWVDAQGNPADEREIIMGEDLTFYASWAKRIDVVYNANGGKFETGEGDMDEHVQNDVRTETEYWLDGWEPHYRLENGGEYYFVGWSLDPKGTEPIENPWMIPSNIEVDEHNCITLYAIWDEGITVTYNGNGGEWWISDDPEGGNWYSVNVREEGPYRSDEQTYHIGTWWPDREGYMFVGWSTNPRATDAMTDFDAALTQNTTYYAIWDKMPVITFNAGEGSFGNDAAAAGSTTITVPWRPGDVLDYDRTFDTGNQNIEPTRQGYRFNGWVDKDGNQFRYIRITGDVEVYASWVKADW